MGCRTERGLPECGLPEHELPERELPLHEPGRWPLNRNPPRTMWVDMNASFATTEQQAHARWRHQPLGVGKYTTPHGPVISPSVEAKQHGIKTAHTVQQCRLLCPSIVIAKSDPPKYREMHRRMLRIFQRWTPNVLAKSIDEACLCFEGSPVLQHSTMEAIARAIKAQIREECGAYVRVSIGYATNQFLAKVAAGLHKPDGLTCLDHRNLRRVLSNLELLDLPGINQRYQARLHMHGIYTPLQFLDASPEFLHHTVFQSIVGRYWSLMLHGFEHQDYEGYARRSYGHSHSIRRRTAEIAPNLAILGMLCDMASRRMRRDGYSCRHLTVVLVYGDGTFFRQAKSLHQPIYSTQEVIRHATLLFNRQKERQVIHRMAVRLSVLEKGAHDQLDLFESTQSKERRAMAAMDALNDRYGEQVVMLGGMLPARDAIDDSISFGSTGDVRQLYEEEENFPMLDDTDDWLWLGGQTGEE